jgi:subtilisin family serine protease
MADSYVVVLKKGSGISTLEAHGVDDTANEMATRFKGRVKHKYRSAVRGFSVTMTPRQARRLAADSRVSYVMQNRKFHMSDVQQNPPSPGLDRIDQRTLPLDDAYTSDVTGAGATVYVIDTGIDTTHPDFEGRAVSGIDTINDDNDSTDCNGHGTHVAATIGGKTFGVAKGVRLVGVRVLDCKGNGDAASVLAGIDFVTNNAVRPAVANMSLGGNVDETLDKAIRSSIESGVTYTLAAGNENADACNTSPARTAEAITVGAVDQNDARPAFSNFGPCVDLFAPGTNIKSASLNGGSTVLSGTSMASPHVAGAAALFLASNPTATPQQVEDSLVANASPGVGNLEKGSPDKLLFTGATAVAAGQTDPATGEPAPIPAVPAGGDVPVTGEPAPVPTEPTPTAPPAGGAAPAAPAAGGGTGSTCGTFSNGKNTDVPSPGTTISEIRVTGCAGVASARTRVDVHVKHPYRGDLGIELVAPDGTVYRLKRPNARDVSADVDGFAVINAAGEAKNGIWKLRVTDSFRGDAGVIDSWSVLL